jgi:hypothetical protein
VVQPLYRVSLLSDAASPTILQPKLLFFSVWTQVFRRTTLLVIVAMLPCCHAAAAAAAAPAAAALWCYYYCWLPPTVSQLELKITRFPESTASSFQGYLPIFTPVIEELRQVSAINQHDILMVAWVIMVMVMMLLLMVMITIMIIMIIIMVIVVIIMIIVFMIDHHD